MKQTVRGYFALGLAAMTLALVGCANTGGYHQASKREVSAQKWLEAAWIVDVLSSAEAGSRQLVVARWTKPVVIVLKNGTDAQREALERAIAEIRLALDGAHQITLATNGTDLARTANVTVQYAPQKEWPALGKKAGLPATLPDAGLDGVHFVAWNERAQVEAGMIIVSDSLTGDLLQHTVLEELFQVMGIRNDSGFFPDSIVYESGNDTGGLPTLSERDKKLIRFLYQHVPPNTRPDRLVKLIDQFWSYGVQ